MRDEDQSVNEHGLVYAEKKLGSFNSSETLRALVSKDLIIFWRCLNLKKGGSRKKVIAPEDKTIGDRILATIPNQLLKETKKAVTTGVVVKSHEGTFYIPLIIRPSPDDALPLPIVEHDPNLPVFLVDMNILSTFNFLKKTQTGNQVQQKSIIQNLVFSPSITATLQKLKDEATASIEIKDACGQTKTMPVVLRTKAPGFIGLGMP